MNMVWALLIAAQTMSSASVTGTVRDASDAVVPGATVQIKNDDTNQTSQAVSDERGRFRLLYLPVGRYHLSVELGGFAPAALDLTLAIGQALDVPIVLRPAGVAETVNVAAPLVEVRRTEMAAAITPREVDTLPLNGRNYLDLALLAPNVSRTILRTNDRFAETSAVPGTGVSVSGQRNLNNTFVVDGLSANDDAADLAGTSFSQEVVREFEVVTSGGAAEFGRASSGAVSMVTQSGTNRMAGRVYEFFRNDAFDARNPLATRKDPLNQNQYGFTLGGPIARDRTFWFGNIERTQQERTGIVTISSAAVASVNAALNAASYGGPRIGTGNYPTGYTTTNVFGRVDHRATMASRLQMRYSLYRVTSENARNTGGLGDVSRGTGLEDTDQTLAVNYLTTLSSGTINEARAQYTRSRLGALANDLVGPAVNISGVANFGTATSSPTARDLDVLQIVDTVTLQRGSHLFKTGVDLLYNRVNIEFPGALQGVYTFTSLANLQSGTYSQFQQAFGAPSQFQSNPNLGVFAQDEWRPRGDLTVNVGLRYDLQWLPEPIQLDANNVSPRLGVAYSPGDGRTVIRASGGLYFDRIPLRATSNALQRDGSKYQTAVLSFGQAGAPAFPNVLPAFPAGVLVSITNINPNLRSGFSQQAGVEVERAITKAVSATVGYNYLRGRAIIMSHNVNVPTLTAAQALLLGIPNLGRPNPNFANISQYDSIGDSWFNSLTMSLGTRPAAWGQTRVSYTLSDAMDDAGNAFFQSPQTQNDILADKGPSDNDQRQRLVLSGSFGDPLATFGAGSAALRRVLGGFLFGYVYSYASGAPFNVVTGSDNNNDTTTNDRPAGVGRNSERLPATSSLDVRISRAFAMAGGHRLEAMIEAFNLINNVNVLNVNNTFGNGTTPNATFGQRTAVGDMRQLQLGVRWSF
ncbi:MAG: carboxypeptidase regulatory-like domain-containing protein [Vicinamibacterales bacterium]